MSKDAVAVKEVSPGYGLKSARSALPNGYKQTEAGIIPDEWEIKRLREISPRQSVGLVINPSTYFNRQGTVPMLVGSNVYENRIDWSAARRITKESNEKLPASQLFPDDLVTVRVGDPGVTAVIPADTDAANCASMMIVRGDKSFVSDWLCYLMNSDYGRNQVKNVQYGTAQKQFNISDAVDFIYPVPPIEEQRAIATALSDVDALLEELDRLIAKKRDLKQATMQQLLTGQTRLPGFKGEWMTKRVGDIAPLQRGFDLPNRQLRAGPYPVVYSNGVLNHHSMFQAQGPGIVTGRSGTIGKVTYVEGPYWPHNTALWVTDFNGNDPRFIFYLYTRINFERFSSGSGVPTLNRNDVHSYHVRVPPTHAEQVEIACILSEMDAEIDALERRMKKVSNLKRAMMQALLTGRTRLI